MSLRDDDWPQGPLVGVDTETAADAEADRILSAALVHQDGTASTTTAWVVDPGADVAADAASPTEQVARPGRPAAQCLAELAEGITAALRAGIPVVAFDADAMLAILDAELERHRLPGVRARLGAPPAPVLDPLVLDRALDGDRPGRRRPVDLCGIYGVAERPGVLHTAEANAEAALDVVRAIGLVHPEVGRLPAGQVHAWLVTVERARAAGGGTADAEPRRQGRV